MELADTEIVGPLLGIGDPLRLACDLGAEIPFRQGHQISLSISFGQCDDIMAYIFAW